MSKQSEVVVFDVIETLFPLDPLRAKLEAVGLPGHCLETWFAQLLRNAFALNATDSYQTFREVATDSLNTLAEMHGRALTEQELAGIIAAFAQLDAHPDVAPAMARLVQKGVRTAALTNGSEQVTRQLLTRAGVIDHIEHVISVDEVQLWKPRKEVYLHCAARCKVAPGEMLLVAAHSWDVHGAKKAGLRTAFLSRKGQQLSTLMAQPDYEDSQLPRLVDQMFAAPDHA